MNLLQAVGLGIVEGLTEFLPVSSTGHLTITEKLMGLPIDSDAITGFTAVVQFGAIVAVLLFFREDILRLIRAAVAGLRSPAARDTNDWRLFLAVVIASLPVGLVGHRSSSRRWPSSTASRVSGRAVSEPEPKSSFSLAARSSRRECR